MNMVDWKLALSIGIPAAVAIVGWIIGHWLNSRRELANRRREARLKGLEVAFTRLANTSHREWTESLKSEFEQFITEIQLYGTPRQVELMAQIVQSFARHDPVVSFDALLEDLRDTLRKELRMEPVIGHVWWFRFTMPQAPGAQPGVYGLLPQAQVKQTSDQGE